MDDSTNDVRIVPLPRAQDVLSGILRQGAQQLLAQAIEAEGADWIDRHPDCRDVVGRRQVVRNGHLPERTITTGVGPVTVQQPRVHDRRPAETREKFSSAILPPYLRKTKSIEELIPYKLPKSVQPKAKEMLHAIYLAPGRAEADKAFDLFLGTYEAKYPKATECLAKDRTELLRFYDFPAEHWMHLQTTNVIESVFATVRLRTEKTKGSGTRIACLTMVFKLMQSAARHWRALNGSGLLADVVKGTVFVDGVKKEDAA